MTSFYDTFSTDKDLEAGKGVTLDYGAAGSITIHRAGGANRKFLTTMDAKLKPYRRQIQAKTMDDSVADRLMAEIYADSIIVGWKGVKDASGKALSYTRDNVIKVLTDLPELFNDIKEQSSIVANFRKEQIETEAKNSVKS